MNDVSEYFSSCVHLGQTTMSFYPVHNLIQMLGTKGFVDCHIRVPK